MKLDTPESKENIENVRQKEVKKELKLINRIRPQRGHTCYDITIATADIKPAKISQGEAVNYPLNEAAAKNPLPVNRRIIVEEGHFYVSALNVKNAYKKYEQCLRQHGAMKELMILKKETT